MDKFRKHDENEKPKQDKKPDDYKVGYRKPPLKRGSRRGNPATRVEEERRSVDCLTAMFADR